MRLAAVLVLLTSILAGCTGGSDGPEGGGAGTLLSHCGRPAAPFHPPEFDVITPGIWQVNATTDRILVWAHNPDATRLNVTWALTGANGTALPSGWQVRFDPAKLSLEPRGTKVREGGSYEYPDWGWSLASLNVPPGTPPMNATLELGNGAAKANVTVNVHRSAARVSGPGDRVNVHYDGKHHDDGTPFDDGTFPTTLGSGQTVPGFDRGLMGLDHRECQRLVIPPALAYGYDNMDPGYVRFNGEWLRFEVWVD